MGFFAFKNMARPMVAASFLILSGCASGFPAGLIYTHTIHPLTTNMHRTPIAKDESEGGIKNVDLHVYNLSATWDSNAIGDIAKKNGIQTVYYADLEYLNVLQIWTEYIVHVYGQ